MPLYEYHCDDCQHDVEVLVRNRQEQPECPDCGSTHLQKLLSVPATPSISSSGSLPVANHQGGGCGRPQCGSGRCMFGD